MRERLIIQGVVHGASSLGTPSCGGTTWSYQPPVSSYTTASSVRSHPGPLRNAS